jgi:hypothetical protein
MKIHNSIYNCSNNNLFRKVVIPFHFTIFILKYNFLNLYNYLKIKKYNFFYKNILKLQIFLLD